MSEVDVKDGIDLLKSARSLQEAVQFPSGQLGSVVLNQLFSVEIVAVGPLNIKHLLI